MAIPTSKLHIRRLLDQVVQNTVGLQRDLHSNAVAWKAFAASGTSPASTMTGWLSGTVASYQNRLNWMATAKSDSATWSQVIALWCAQGGGDSDIDDLFAPLQDAVNQLAIAPAQSYADIIAACDQIIATVNAPPSIWPE